MPEQEEGATVTFNFGAHCSTFCWPFLRAVLRLRRSMLLEECVRACREELVHALISDPS